MMLKNWARKLFSGRSRRPIVTRPRATWPDRPTRLGLESLDDRCLPSVTAAFSNGVLTITANTANTAAAVVAEYIPNSLSLHKDVYVADNYAGRENVQGGDSSGGVSLNSITSIVYKTGANPASSYSLNNDTPIDVSMYSGSQLFDTVAPGQTITDGLAQNAYKYPSEMNQSVNGGITAYLNSTDTVLTIAGPTGGGFQLVGHWTDTQTAVGYGEYTNYFTASGTVQLETGLVINGKQVAIPIPMGRQFGVTTEANFGTSQVGEYAGISLGGFSPLNNLSQGNNTLGNLLNMTSLSFSGSGVQWGIELGSGSDLQALGMPLLADVPYLYASFNTGESVSFGSNISASTDGASGAIVFDPADPAIYVQGGDSQIGTFSGAVSLHGAIPYTPNALPSGYPDPDIYGNVYLSANGINLGDLPLAASGSLVLGLDANHDGKFLSMLSSDQAAIRTLFDQLTGTQDGNQSAALFQQLNNLAHELPGAMNDIEVGLNGTLSMSTAAYGISLNVNAGTGSAFYKPNSDGGRTVTFDVQTVDPFAGTVLDNLAPKLTAEVGGSITTGANDQGIASWKFYAIAESSSFAGFSSDSLFIYADSATMTATVNMNMQGLLGLTQEYLYGSVNLSNGAFNLTYSDQINESIGHGIPGFQLIETFSIGWNPTTGFYFDAALSASTSVISFNADLNFSVDSSGDVDVSGSGTLWVKDLGSLSLGFNDDDFYFDLLGANITVSW
ncbi:hypothetical protein [Frigoriglobus tundricola]|uniref:Uncharacterized protein n=1 Tax=Frigoriglobus tundricola TaxID=2774151 RepID=A0A6M5YP87_9BACT|nr:hypothetical protein [Frigoriglobus tundricola]QJW95887.1 hypothetical protein FTUN_3441 [Frigoriglobus tundricola]